MITTGIAILLAIGLIAAKICQRIHLPSVTGYIIAGLLLGPTGINLISEQSIGHNLDHFTNIALMLIAFGIGEHIEIKNLKKHARSLLFIALFETSCTLVVVTSAIFGVITLTGLHIDGWQLKENLALSILLGAVSVATAPAATLLVIRELKAKGPLTSTLMAIVAIDNGLAIILFGFAVSLTHQIIGQSEIPLIFAIGNGFLEIFLSLLLGWVTGFCLETVLRRLKKDGEMLTAGLAILLLCSQFAVFMNLSALLAGMVAGFTLVNKAERDVRVFRVLNSFEPPIYVLFFTLAGTHLDIKTLGSVGILGIVYFLARITGKISGVQLGSRFGNTPDVVRKHLGFTLVPQAGVAIGLIFLISADPSLAFYSSVITPVVLTGVFLSELIGPLSAKFAVIGAKEATLPDHEDHEEPQCLGFTEKECDQFMRSEAGIKILPWTWQKLQPAATTESVVVFGATRRHTVNGIARIATIFAHYHKALPMAVLVRGADKPPVPANYFQTEREEVKSMGYNLLTEVVPDREIASGLVAAVEYNNAKAVVLSYPLHDETSDFPKILETVAENVSCPVVVVQFYGILHTEKILVPVTDMDDLAEVYPVVAALDTVGEHQIQLLYLISSDTDQDDINAHTERVYHWLKEQPKRVHLSVKAVPTDSRVECIQQEAEKHDIVVMGAIRAQGVRKFFFGSLADSLAKKLKKPFIVVYDAKKDQ
ncbi:Kef-type K+ transport system, membrane component [Desulfocapsa sulfexigens DSM 10523]|uniref:Kef-type K+ transport system, membrane component n=1 Tax=Desulfocapsa sulfexigens (strain DSM 10523 / SB164P1) TaxID=1167006 RepID=M1P219_DESSD|nr:cation:proton antiporter [Desulfocapsa sulfexigens]AGF77513.1 Kef-type K+ transport system, membrane component [Desulfocapsa sulfexigens DSM 10523]